MIEFTEMTEDGEGITHELPSKFEVCSGCNGHGTHLNRNIGEHAYTQEEFDEAFSDEDRKEYFKRGGIYDVTCETCDGARVEEVVNEATCPENLLKKYQASQEEDRAFARECAAERAMGA